MPIQKVLTQQRVPVRVWASDVDKRLQEHLSNIASLPFIPHHVAAMPVVHLGVLATIASVIATHKAITSAAIGVHNGCDAIGQAVEDVLMATWFKEVAK